MSETQKPELPPWVAGGHSTRKRAGRRAVLSFEAYVKERNETAKLLQEAANEARAEERPEPLVLGPLAVGVDPRTGEQRVLSESRREYWPGTSAEFVTQDKTNRLGNPVERAIRSVGVLTALVSKAKGLFKRRVAADA